MVEAEDTPVWENCNDTKSASVKWESHARRRAPAMPNSTASVDLGRSICQFISYVLYKTHKFDGLALDGAGVL
jgi:hypothetical protein